MAFNIEYDNLNTVSLAKMKVNFILLNGDRNAKSDFLYAYIIRWVLRRS